MVAMSSSIYQQVIREACQVHGARIEEGGRHLRLVFPDGNFIILSRGSKANSSPRLDKNLRAQLRRWVRAQKPTKPEAST